MESSEIPFLSATELSALLRAREVSPVEATQAYLDRVDQVDGKLNSYITISREEALAQARQADSEMAAGNYRGPMHGVPVAGRDLVADGLTCAGGQYRQQAISQHGLLDNLFLQGRSVAVGGLWPELLEAEPSGQLPDGIVALTAPLAVRTLARAIAQLLDHPPRFGELKQDPWGHYRVRAGDRQPRQDVGQRTSLFLSTVND